MNKNIFFGSVGVIFSRGLMLIAGIILARFFSKEDFGGLSMVQSTSAMLATLALLGFNVAITRFVAQNKSVNLNLLAKYIRNTVSLSVLILSVIVVLALIFSKKFIEILLADKVTVANYILCLPIAFFGCLNIILVSVLSGLEMFKAVTKMSVFGGLIAFPVYVGCSYFFGLGGAIVGLGFNGAVALYLNFIILRAWFNSVDEKIFFEINKEHAKQLIIVSVPAFLTSLVAGPVNWICSAILANEKNGLEELAKFAVADQWYVIILIFPGVVGSVLYPAMAKNIKNKNDKDLLFVGMKVNFLVSLVIAGVFIIMSDVILNIYGKNYKNISELFIICVATGVLVALNNPIVHYMSAKNKMWTQFFINLVWAAVFVIMVFIFKGYGAYSIALGRLTAYIVISVAQYYIIFNAKAQKI